MGLEIPAAADRLAHELGENASSGRAVNEKRYLKSDLHHFGVSVPVIRKTARSFAREHEDASKVDLVGLSNELWDRDVYELRKLAVNIFTCRTEMFEASDVPFIERMLRRSHTWALIDDLAMNVVAPILGTFNDAEAVRARWSRDGDFWVRRTAMLALLLGLRKGTTGWAEFASYSEAMLEEEEFFIRKAIGWVLREVSEHSPELVAEWLRPRATIASSVTMREAIKYLPDEERLMLTSLRSAGGATRRNRAIRSVD